MITRLFRVRIHANMRDMFEKAFEEISLPQVQAQAGLLAASFGKPSQWTPYEYVLITQWKDIESLEAFVGKQWNKAIIPKEMQKYVDQCWVHHYETDPA